MKYEVWQSAQDGQWHWHLKAKNGEVIAQGEGYASKPMCLKGIRAVKRSLLAKVIEL